MKRGRLSRFLVVGVGAAVLLFGLTWLFARAGMPPFWGSAVAYAIAFAIAYTAQRNWTFGGGHAHGRALPRYFAVQAGCALTAGVVSHIAIEGFGLPPAAMAAVVTVAASAVSYLLSTFWVFPEGGARLNRI